MAATNYEVALPANDGSEAWLEGAAVSFQHNGVVSLEAHKRGTKIWFDMLSLDVRGSKQHMFLKGDKDRPLFPEIAEVLGGLRK